MKKLVVYFSRVGENSVNGRIEIIKKGFTEILAEKIASLTGAAMYKIEPVVLPSSTELQSMSSITMALE